MGNQDKRRDHFVARTYLRRFAQKGKGKKYILNVYDRLNKKYIKPSPENICCEVGWDIMATQPDKHILRKLLQDIEPKLNEVIDRILNKELFIEDRLILSWYLSIILLLNPEYLDNSKKNYEAIIKTTAEILIDNGTIDMPPEIEKILGGKHNFQAEVNPDYIKAFIAKLLQNIAFDVYNSPWFIITINSEDEFLTSDKPFYFMCCPHNYYCYPKYISLDPKHLLLIPPTSVNECDSELGIEPKFTFENAGKVVFVDVDSSGAELFNKYTISNANRFIIAHQFTDKLKTLIKENIKFKTSMIQNTIPVSKGQYIFSTVYCNRNIEDKEDEFKLLRKILLTDSNN